MPYVSGTRVAELNFSYFLTEAFDSECCAEPLSWHLSFSFITLYVLIALPPCKFHKIEFFKAVFHLPRTCHFESRPSCKKCRWCALSAALPLKQARSPLFFFIISIITKLLFNGNSVTSGKEAVIYIVRAWKTRRNVELDGQDQRPLERVWVGFFLVQTDAFLTVYV